VVIFIHNKLIKTFKTKSESLIKQADCPQEIPKGLQTAIGVQGSAAEVYALAGWMPFGSLRRRKFLSLSSRYGIESH
jgi:hypothetical protein